MHSGTVSLCAKSVLAAVGAQYTMTVLTAITWELRVKRADVQPDGYADLRLRR